MGMWVLGLGFGGFLLWAALAPLDEGVPAQGVVTLDTKRKTVQHLSGGIVKEVLVHEGQQVKEGALLRLSVKPGRAKEPPNVSAEAYAAPKNELQKKDSALADQAVELAILRKKTSGGSWDR
jgi:multidrug efflux pump subunit AcrA (membrane-fusion protein)